MLKCQRQVSALSRTSLQRSARRARLVGALPVASCLIFLTVQKRYVTMSLYPHYKHRWEKHIYVYTYIPYIYIYSVEYLIICNICTTSLQHLEKHMTYKDRHKQIINADMYRQDGKECKDVFHVELPFQVWWENWWSWCQSCPSTRYRGISMSFLVFFS